ncbi:hypothetical protein HMPREF1624_08631 [Sporothrix schenckii ATCC 58251]|uniref:Uncharacterized protein n=1 Tax=Sporothrix schenckii (strain ATCC 58251 / de Perez 2211183) TaxID=1391915 RepID=U7PK81_SPOS1|nr:hypothetical protein HMPREF1624_08631 [Sporothrix schenckii ATCC 58251]
MHTLSTLAVAGLAAVVSAAPAPADGFRLTVDTATTYQTIDGFGFSEAFQRAHQIIDLPEATRAALVDLLFNATSGAGFSILRNGIGSSPNSTQDWMNTIEPDAPAGGPAGAPHYVWDGRDSGQFWVAQQAAAYGVKTFYADAWSAPGFMKNNSDDAGGGYLCGSPGAPVCASGDWRKAYAEYLVENVQLYKEHGINITHLGFLNEPDLTTAYASMLMDGAMAADFIKILHAVLAAHGLEKQVHIACCDATGWATQRNMSDAILRDADAAPLVDVFTTHLYTSKVDTPLPTRPQQPQHAWMSEYADLGGNWSTTWFNAAAAAANDTDVLKGDGLTWAQHLHTGLTTGNLSAFLWWVATQDTQTNGNNNEKLVLVDLAAGTYTVAKRLWAFAQFSRAARPGAVRVAVKTTGVDGCVAKGASPLRTVAFHNADGSVSVVAINDGAVDVSISVRSRVANAVSAEAWATDETRDLEPVAVTVDARGDVTAAAVPAHGVLSVIVRV